MVTTAASSRSRRNLAHINYRAEKIINQPQPLARRQPATRRRKKGAKRARTVLQPAVHAQPLPHGRDFVPLQLFSVPLEIHLKIYRDVGLSTRRANIPGFERGSWTTHRFSQNMMLFNRRVRAGVELIIDEANRELPARTVVDFAFSRQLPRLLYMIEEAIKLERTYHDLHAEDDNPNDDDPEWLKFDRMTPYTSDLAASYFLNPRKYGEIFKKLSEEETQRIIGPHRRNVFARYALNTLGASPETLQPGALYHLRRFLRATLARLRNSHSYWTSPFSPGDFEIVVEMPPLRNGLYLDSDTRLYTINEADVVRYLYKFSKVFDEHLRLSFSIQRAELGNQGSVQNNFNRFQIYKIASANDPEFRINVDGVDL